LVDRFQVQHLATKPVKHLSLGERMRCELIGCFLHAPKVLFLDEPTIGLDVEAKATLRDLIREMCATSGCTLLLTSHDTGDMESVCNRVIMIHHGQVVFDNSVDALRRSFVHEKILSVSSQTKDFAWEALGLPVIEKKTHSAKLRVDTSRQNLQDAIKQVLATGTVSDLTIEDPPMEETIKRIYARKV
jgi:ABC-2 type transport system ATP-binding protein